MNQTTLQAVRNAYLLPYSDHTLNLYTHQLDRWFAWCRSRQIAALEAGRTDVEQYIQHLYREIGLQPSSVHTCLTPVRGFYRFAYAEGIIDRDLQHLLARPGIPSPTETPSG